MKFKHNVDSEISIAYIVTKKKLTLVAAMGVTIGIAIFIFLNSLVAGFDVQSADAIFKSIAHLRIYKDDETSEPLSLSLDSNFVIVNPKIVPRKKVLVNPNNLVATLKAQEGVTYVVPQVNVNAFFNNGKSQISGFCVGFDINEADKMFRIKSTIVEGSLDELNANPNGILLGNRIAEIMNVKTGDNISITSSKNILKVMKVVGLFQTKNSNVDKTKSYINIQAAQQLLGENTNYITDINVNVDDYEMADKYAAKFTSITGYKAEDWKAANETLVAGSRMRKIMIKAISFSILLVAGFGIYNILNMTITQKINDIAILKAMGFKGKDVVRIFVQQALIIGFIGVALGMLMSTILVNRMMHVYIGGDIGYFPINYEPIMYLKGLLFGFVVTFAAGYIPARKAADVDPVSILRK